MQILTLINFLGAVQGLFLGLVILGRSRGRPDRRLLGLLCLVFAVSILGGVLGLSGYYRQYPHLIRIGDPLVLLCGPLIFLYVRTLAGRGWQRRDWLHFLPFVLYVSANLPFYLATGAEKIAFVERVFRAEQPSPFIVAISMLRVLYIGSYVGLAFVPLRRYARRIRAQFSNIDRINLFWLRRMMAAFLIICITALAGYSLMLVTRIDFVEANNVIALAISACIYLLAYLGMREEGILATAISPGITAPEREEDAGSTGYVLPAGQRERLERKLQDVFFDGQAYLQSDLTVQGLADQMGVPAYQLSAFINERYRQNFFDFVNYHRVEVVKHKLKDPANDRYTLLALAFESGFNSKSTFNAAFKKHTGLTPSQYRGG